MGYLSRSALYPRERRNYVRYLRILRFRQLLSASADYFLPARSPPPTEAAHLGRGGVGGGGGGRYIYLFYLGGLGQWGMFAQGGNRSLDGGLLTPYDDSRCFGAFFRKLRSRGRYSPRGDQLDSSR